MSAAESYEERDRVLAELEIAHAAALADGLDIICNWAALGRPFSANDCRAELRTAGVPPQSTGALFAKAVATGIIKLVGYEMSTDPRTRHRIASYWGIGAKRPEPEPEPEPVDLDVDEFAVGCTWLDTDVGDYCICSVTGTELAEQSNDSEADR